MGRIKKKCAVRDARLILALEAGPDSALCLRFHGLTDRCFQPMPEERAVPALVSVAEICTLGRLPPSCCGDPDRASDADDVGRGGAQRMGPRW